jgi:hypothetical protein
MGLRAPSCPWLGTGFITPLAHKSFASKENETAGLRIETGSNLWLANRTASNAKGRISSIEH